MKYKLALKEANKKSKQNNKPKLKVGDMVIVAIGKYKGQKGKLKTVLPKENKCIIENVTLSHKHKKPKSAEDKGGIIKIDSKIDISNVAFYDTETNQASKIGYKIDKDGKKVRVLKKTGKVIVEEKYIKKNTQK